MSCKTADDDIGLYGSATSFRPRQHARHGAGSAFGDIDDA
jgi:hypothetical protein